MVASSAIRLIVGLGNPGEQYAKTRHNAGAWLVEGIAEKAGVVLKSVAKLHGLHAKVSLHAADCHLFIPTTYMNHSGRAVQAIVNYYNIPLDALLVAHDDIDLAVGDIRLKYDGGDGGHNGLKDIFGYLPSRQFYRLRIGVGHPGQREQVVDYVLKPPSKGEKASIMMAIAEAEAVFPLLIAGETAKAMQQLHTR